MPSIALIVTSQAYLDVAAKLVCHYEVVVHIVENVAERFLGRYALPVRHTVVRANQLARGRRRHMHARSLASNLFEV